MRQKDEELFFKDLCARLPYGVKCNALLKQIDGSLKSVFGTFKGYNRWVTVGDNLVDIETVRPYLRPMSSMTEEEWLTLKEWILIASDTEGKIYFDGFRNISADDTIKAIDYLISHYFDYRGLIPMGLALEAPEGMYNV